MQAKKDQQFLLMMTLMPVLFVTGCISTAYRDSVAEFGAAAEAAVELQSTNLKAIIDAENAVIRRQLAEARVDLIISGECIEAVLAEGSIREIVSVCSVMEGDGAKLRAAPDFAHILKLGGALGSYSASIAQLATDSSEDRAAFKISLTGAASAASQLDGALRTALEVEGKPLPEEKLGVLAGIVGDIGGLLMEKQRVNALKQIIIEADPIVQQSIQTLHAAYLAEQSYNLTDRTRELRDSQQELSRLNADETSTIEQRLAAQAKFIEIAENYVQLANARDRFSKIGAAHAALAKAAGDQATKDDIKAGIEAVFEVSKSVGEAVPKLNSEEAN